MAEQFEGFQITCAFYLFDFAGWELGIDEVHQRHVAFEGFQHPAAGLLVEGIFGQFVECRFVSAFIDDDRAVVNAVSRKFPDRFPSVPLTALWPFLNFPAGAGGRKERGVSSPLPSYLPASM